MKLPLVILAGGLGSRLGEKTKDIPKALIDVAGQPFIFRQLNYLKDQGFKKIVICTAYRGNQIKEYVGNGSKFSLNISYSDDGEEMLGTGGSVKKASNMFDKNFFILYGDSFLPIDFSLVESAFNKENKPALMTVLKNTKKLDKSNAYFNNKIVHYNKRNPDKMMDYIDYGLTVVDKSIFTKFPTKKNFDLADVFEDLSKRNQLAGIEISVRFYEIGSINGLRDTIEFFKKEENRKL